MRHALAIIGMSVFTIAVAGAFVAAWMGELGEYLARLFGAALVIFAWFLVATSLIAGWAGACGRVP